MAKLTHPCKANLARNPRGIQSAGFSVPGTCLHCAVGMGSCMSETLFPTKSFHREGCERIQVSATFASV